MGLKLPGQHHWERLSGRERLIIGFTVVALLGAGAFQLHSMQQQKLQRLTRQLESFHNQIVSLSAELPVKQRDVARATAQQQSAKERKSQFAKTREQLVGGGTISSLLTEMTNLANQENIVVVSVQPGETRNRGEFSELPITLEVKSRFRNLAEYLQQLEHLSELVVVGKIQIKTTPQTSPELSVNVEVVSFFGTSS